jgi:hypothetical protein
MLRDLTGNGKGFQDATASIQEFKLSLEDTTDRTYALAQAVQQVVDRTGGFQARQEGGYFGDLQFRMINTQSKLAAPDLRSEDMQALIAEQETQTEELTAKKLEAYQTYRQFNIGTARQEKAFELQMLHSREDFHIAMVQGEEDFARSMGRAAEDAAKAMYSPFQRVFEPGTMGSDQIVQNMKDQNELIENQMKNLKLLKNRYGLDQATIDQMGLADASQAFQVERMVEEGGAGIGAMNKQARRKQGAVTAFTQSDLNQDYRRTVEDRERSITRSLRQFDRMMERSREAYQTQMDYAIWDLEQYGKELGMSSAEISANLQIEAEKALGETSTTVRAGVDADISYIMGMLDDLTALARYNPAKGIIAAENQDKIPTPGYGIKAAENQDIIFTDEQMKAPTGWMNAFKSSNGRWYANTGGSHKGAPVALPLEWGDWDARGDHVLMSDWWTNNVAIPGLFAGGVVKGAMTARIGEKSAEMVVPLHGAEGKSFVAEMATQITSAMVRDTHTAGKGATVVNIGHSTHVVNNTSAFSGITVKADDPMVMSRKLQAAARARNMRQGANAGG